MSILGGGTRLAMSAVSTAVPGCAAMRAAASLAMFLSLLAAAFALSFPPLTGRVVDQANIVPADARGAMETKLADLESKSGIQLVVATVTSLEGREIEPYANQLFRAWQLGEKAKNNGVLLLVAPNEHRVRIEVGYGLEGTLTDALASVIIANAITPRFKTGDFAGGISRGVDDIITVLTTDSSEWGERPELRLDRPYEGAPVGWVLLGLLILFIVLMTISRSFRSGVISTMLSFPTMPKHSRGGGGFSSDSWPSAGGGFSGGGGSSGGGGASGSW
jgi:uncharacterized protein